VVPKGVNNPTFLQEPGPIGPAPKRLNMSKYGISMSIVKEIRELLEFYDVEDVAMITGVHIGIVKMVRNHGD
jgi:hypothetical protein